MVVSLVANHPRAELSELRRLDEGLAPGDALAGTSPFLDRYLAHDYFEIYDVFDAAGLIEKGYCEKVVKDLRQRRAKWLVVGNQALRGRPRALIGLGEAPVGLRKETSNDAFTTWRVLPEK